LIISQSDQVRINLKLT